MDLNKLTTEQREQIAAANNKIGFMYHLNGSVGTTSSVVNFTEYTNQIMIYNTHATNTLYVSFDSGSNWFNVPYGSTLSFDECTVKSFLVKGSDASTTYQILYSY